MNAQSTAIAEQREQPPLVVLKSQLEERAESFRMALPSHIKPVSYTHLTLPTTPYV